MKISFMLRIGDGKSEPFSPEDNPDILKALNYQALTGAGYVPVEEKGIPVRVAAPTGTGSE